MGLIKSKGNMYDWVTHTWNPIKGKCYHNCSYCYMKKWGKLPPIHLDEKELKTDLGEGNFIFVCSGCDMFANDIPFDWIIDVLKHCAKYKNKYFFQSKNTRGFIDAGVCMPDEIVLCTTIESNILFNDIMNRSPHPYTRAKHFGLIPIKEKYITIEPIMEFDLPILIGLIYMCRPKQVNIGADSKGHNLPEPPKEKILELISELGKFTIVKQKPNLKRLL